MNVFFAQQNPDVGPNGMSRDSTGNYEVYRGIVGDEPKKEEGSDFLGWVGVGLIPLVLLLVLAIRMIGSRRDIPRRYKAYEWDRPFPHYPVLPRRHRRRRHKGGARPPSEEAPEESVEDDRRIEK